MSTSEQSYLPQTRQSVPGSPDQPAPTPPARTPAQIERDIEARRQRLSGTVDTLVDRVSPRNVARRQVAAVKTRVTDDEGNLRRDLVGGAAGVAVVLIVLWAISRRRNS